MTAEQLEINEETEETSTFNNELVYGLNDKPPVVESIFVALQHVLAIFVGIITPPLIICNALKLGVTDTNIVVSMSLFISGIATFIQIRKIGPVGSGLLSIQGTSFGFLAPILAIGLASIEAGSTPTQALALIFGSCILGSFIEIILSRFLTIARKVFPPLVTGIVVTVIGLSLIKVGVTSIAGGFAAQQDGSFGSIQNLSIAGIVLITIIIASLSSNRFLRMSSIVIGLIVGYIISIALGRVDFAALRELPLFNVPLPFRYGVRFSLAGFLPIALLYVMTTIESIGDLTATSMVSKEPIKGPVYVKRIKGGVLGDGINSLIAACFNTFPNTTFSQNNGIIQLTGVGSRYVGYYIAAILSILGLFPIIGGIFQILPQPVLGGATIIMFGAVAVAGIGILSTISIGKRELVIIAVGLGAGLGVTFVPEILDAMPPLIKNTFSSGITSGGVSAILLNLLLPKNAGEEQPSRSKTKIA